MVHIAIPEPTSPQFVPDSAAYNQRSLPQYLHALISAAATPIPLPLHESPQRIARILSTCHGILLPGSPADIDPQTYGQTPQGSEPPDPARAAVDQLLLEDAFRLQKPILAICQGLQALNTSRNGTLIQDIPTQVGTLVDHAPGREIHEAHQIKIAPNTRLFSIWKSCRPAPLVSHPNPLLSHRDQQICHPEQTGVPKDRSSSVGIGSEGPASPQLPEYVNSSHHQSIQTPGDNLTVSAISPKDGVIEAIELDSESHFVLAVQWHPERSYNQSPLSRAIFQAFIQAAEAWSPREIPTAALHA